MVTPLEFNSFQVFTRYLCISHILASYIVIPCFFGRYSIYASVVSSHIVSVSTYAAELFPDRIEVQCLHPWQKVL
uniref:Uncharacterized protein n=1 Tax=Aegilops tauschii subsp. strangulata TaxID=200361 RepID=A0A453D890_AEGTS